MKENPKPKTVGASGFAGIFQRICGTCSEILGKFNPQSVPTYSDHFSNWYIKPCVSVSNKDLAQAWLKLNGFYSQIN